jgi:hypothetical protein
MEDFQRYLVATGLLPKDIGVDAYYTEDLISKINDFNVDKIVALAKGYVAK